MSDGYAKSYRELVETTDWPSTGAGAIHGANFMAHHGYEPTAMLATMGSLKQPLRALAVVQGPGAHDQEGADGMGMPDVTGPAAAVLRQAR